MDAATAWIMTGGGVAVLLGLSLVVAVRGRGWATTHRARSASLNDREDRVCLRESTLETKARTLEMRESNLIERERSLAANQATLEDERVVLRKRLEEIADYTADEARQELLERAGAEARADARSLVRELEGRAREEAGQRARDIVAAAIQRVATETTASVVTSTVPLADELKGRIIGRDGRNIRSFEHITGVDVIVDDTPGAVMLSSFDPVRRETARRTLVALVEDGRIHPGRIESAFAKARQEVDEAIDNLGDEAASDAQVPGLPAELRRLLGQLEYRTSYGQNVRRHSVESALLAGGMAEEIGADAALVRRCALLHDIGKALSHRVQGSHASVGAEVARRLGESEPVCHAVAAHHGEVEPRTVEAVLTQAADAVSASRPGARRDALEQHCSRLRRIEEVCAEYGGVKEAFAMQAGREVRLMVRPEDVDDAGVHALSREVATRIQEEVHVPGPVTVTVIRETRARSKTS